MVAGNYNLDYPDDEHYLISGDVTPAADDKSIPIYGHHLFITDDTVECRDCGMEEEIPKIFLRSNDFYTVIYQLYAVGLFKQSTCQPSLKTDESVLTDNTINTDFGGNTYSTSSDQKI